MDIAAGFKTARLESADTLLNLEADTQLNELKEKA